MAFLAVNAIPKPHLAERFTFLFVSKIRQALRLFFRGATKLRHFLKQA